MEVDVIDNCYLKPMTQHQVLSAFGARVQSWQQLSAAYRARDAKQLQQNSSFLPPNWPMSSFVNANNPRVIYTVTNNGEEFKSKDRFGGFLEASVKKNMIAKLLQCVVFHHNNMRPSDQIERTKNLCASLTRDCVNMDVTCILIPRAVSDYSPNETANGARYSFGSQKPLIHTIHRIAMCHEIAKQFPFMHFKSPYRSQCVQVTNRNLHYLPELIELFLDPPRNKNTREFYRTCPVVLWTTLGRHLTQTEHDIVIDWQRKLQAHPALELKNDIPVAIYGKPIVIVAESASRLSIACYRYRQDVPLQVQSIENYLWEFGIQYKDQLADDVDQTIVDFDKHQSALRDANYIQLQHQRMENEEEEEEEEK